MFAREISPSPVERELQHYARVDVCANSWVDAGTAALVVQRVVMGCEFHVYCPMVIVVVFL
jgi:hypothetical protein